MEMREGGEGGEGGDVEKAGKVGDPGMGDGYEEAVKVADPFARVGLEVRETVEEVARGLRWRAAEGRSDARLGLLCLWLGGRGEGLSCLERTIPAKPFRPKILALLRKVVETKQRAKKAKTATARAAFLLQARQLQVYISNALKSSAELDPGATLHCRARPSALREVQLQGAQGLAGPRLFRLRHSLFQGRPRPSKAV